MLIRPTALACLAAMDIRVSYAGGRDWSDATVSKAIESLLPK